MYTENEIVAVAGRVNNTKRNYLVVNKLQAKHIPVRPDKALEMFRDLALLMKEDVSKALVIGFAETATAIGSAIAIELKCRYIQTTREKVEDAEFLYFSEEHSHATEQRIDAKSIRNHIDEIEHIIFAEDEVTTGNTILNATRILKNEFGDKLKFSVMSLINGMNESSLEKFRTENINVYYLMKTDNSKFSKLAENFIHDGNVYEFNGDTFPTRIRFVRENYINPRKLTDGVSYEKACRYFAEQVLEDVGFDEIEEEDKILVIGTEEFMYPAIYIGKILCETGAEVYCHSTTRSPIAVSTQDDYPLHTRYQIRSFYDVNRTTYIYNIEKYDMIIVVSDGDSDNERAQISLTEAFRHLDNGCTSIYIWENKENKS